MKNELFSSIGAVILLSLFCLAGGTCKKWQYDECLAVGHDKTYCMAEVAGCFSRK